MIDGVYVTLNEGQAIGGQAHGICYCFQQNQREEVRNMGEQAGALTAEPGMHNNNYLCYPINLMVATRGGKDDMRTCFGIGEQNEPQFTLSAAHEHGVCYCIEGNVVDRVSTKNGKGWCEDVSPTLNTQDRHAVAFLIDAMSSNSMKSSNPNSGIHETDITKCLDTTCLDPGCNQGGCMVVVYDGSSVTSPKNWNNPSPGDPCYALHTDSRNYVCISLEGNGARPSHMGKGFSDDGKMYTLNTIEQHSVCYCVDCRNGCLNEELAITLQAKNQGGFSVNCTPPILRLSDDESACI